MTLLILILLFIRTTPHLTPLELSLETPTWAHQWQRLQRLYVFTATPQGIFVSTAPTMNVPIADDPPQVTLNIVAFITTVLFADALVTPPAIVQTDSALSAMSLDTLSQTVPSLRTPAVVSLLQYMVITFFFALFIFLLCLLTCPTCLPFQLCSLQTIIGILSGNFPLLSCCFPTQTCCS